MKKHIILLAIVLGVGLNLNAQIRSNENHSKNDAFFSSSFSEFREGNSTNDSWINEMPAIIGHAYDQNQSAYGAPLGSGLLVLAGLGAAYAIRRKQK